MKRTLQFLALTSLAFFALSFTSCSGDDDKVPQVIGSYTIDGVQHDIKYAYFTQDGDKYMFGVSNSNNLNTGNKNWLGFYIPESKFDTDINFDGNPDVDAATFVISIDGTMLAGQNNELGNITSGNLKVSRKNNNIFNVAVDMTIDGKVVIFNIETKFSKIPYDMISGMLPK